MLSRPIFRPDNTNKGLRRNWRNPLLLLNKWRRVRDLNPRGAYHAYTISSRAPSAARTTLRVETKLGGLYQIVGKLQMAERVGFEPTVPVKAHLISSQAPSTSRTPLRKGKSTFIGRRRTASVAKKSLHRCSALVLPDPRSHRQPVIQRRMLNHIEDRLHRSGPKIRASVYQPVDPAHHQGSRAHRTRLDRNIQSCAGQPPTFQLAASLPDYEHFSVGSGIMVGFAAIVRLGDHFAGKYQNRADRHFAFRRSLLSFRQRQSH